MFNLIKMDFYRLFHSKVFRVGIIVAAILAFLGMLLNLGVIEIIKLASNPNDPESIATMGILFPVLAWIEGVDFADVIFTGAGTAALFVSCMMISTFIGAEQSCGYTKNIAGQLPNRGITVISKFIVTCFIQLVILLVFVGVSILCAVLFFSSYIKTYSIGVLIGGLALRFFLYCAMTAVLLFFCTLTKSNAVSMVIGAIFGIGVTGIVYWAASGLLKMINITLDIAKLMPDGINGLINVYSIGGLVVRAIIIGVIFISALLTASVLLFKNRDVK
jgi:ABC-type transport system involved in multi-copper enzyme maturation permease subunit